MPETPTLYPQPFSSYDAPQQRQSSGLFPAPLANETDQTRKRSAPALHVPLQVMQFVSISFPDMCYIVSPSCDMQLTLCLTFL